MESPAAKPATEIQIQSTTAGVIEDFEAFIEKFTATKSVRYEHFLDIWKEMHMSLIFAGRQSDQECREFTEECLQLALSYSSSSQQFQVRVWALYMLYAIYFKHPFYLRVKIRITLAEWHGLLRLISEIHQQKHLDAEYVFTRLRHDHAFYFVATKTEMYPGARSQANDNDLQQQKLDLLLEEKSIVSQLFEPDTIDQLSAIHEEYHRVKSGLIAHTSSVQQSLNVIENGLVQNVTKAIAVHETWRKTRVGKKLSSRRRREDAGSIHSTSESEPDSDFEQSEPHGRASASRSVASVRAEIKSRAFKSSTAPRRYRRRASVNNRRQTADDKENTTAEHSEPPTAQPSSTGTDAGAGLLPRESVEIASMPLITTTTDHGLKPSKVKTSKTRKPTGDPETAVGRGRKRKRTQSRPSKRQISGGSDDHDDNNKGEKSPSAAAAAVEDGGDAVRKKKVKEKKVKEKKVKQKARAAAEPVSAGEQEHMNKTVKCRKTGKKKTPSAPAAAAAETDAAAVTIGEGDKKASSAARRKKPQKRPATSSSSSTVMSSS